jgi:hypothetical protein
MYNNIHLQAHQVMEKIPLPCLEPYKVGLRGTKCSRTGMPELKFVEIPKGIYEAKKPPSSTPKEINEGGSLKGLNNL